MNEFNRIAGMISQKEMQQISKLKVLIVGIGGVGGFAFESLIRSGVKNITIVDADIIDISNLNRQLITLQNNIGKEKTEEAIKRAALINPKAKITSIKNFITKDNINTLFKRKYDYIIDACDTISTKVALIQKAHESKTKIISSMGTGNKLDPSQLAIVDIRKTSYDPIAKILRKLLKDLHINGKVMVVSSTEKPKKSKNKTPGSMIFVPATAGILCASYIINDALNKAKTLQ